MSMSDVGWHFILASNRLKPMIDTPIKTVFLLDSLKRGGVQSGVLIQIPRLNPSRYDVRVWVLRKGESDEEFLREFQEAGISVEFIPAQHYRDRNGILSLAQRLADERVILLNTHSFYPNIVGRLAGAIAGVPATIVNYHHTYSHQWEPKLVAFERMLRRETDAFVCVSQTVREALQPLLRLPQDRIRVLLNGLDLDPYETSADRSALRGELGLPLDRPLIASVGRLTAIKDLDTLIRALQHLLQTQPRVLILIIGDGQERPRLEQMARDLGVGESVRFLGARGDVPQLLQASDCMVLTSLMEGFGRVIVEAFAACAPVITTPAGGVTELVQHERNGLLIPFQSPEEVAWAVERTLTQTAETRRRVEQARRDVRQYDLETWVRKTESIFEETLDRAHSRPLGRPPSPLLQRLRYGKLRFDFQMNRLLYRMGGRLTRPVLRSTRELAKTPGGVDDGAFPQAEQSHHHRSGLQR
ncbi:glycosyltransferase family 4 protein [bacterium]|nr:glycosyltransferase family 4 protein [bacterium]